MSNNGMLDKKKKQAEMGEDVPPYLKVYNESALRCMGDSVDVLLGKKSIEEYEREVDALVEAELKRLREIRAQRRQAKKE